MMNFIALLVLAFLVGYGGMAMIGRAVARKLARRERDER